MTVTPDLITDFSFSFKLHDENGVMRDLSLVRRKGADLPRHDYRAGDSRLSAGDAVARHRGQGRGPRLAASVSRYDVIALPHQRLSALLAEKKVAIIGLGGTGSYILDFLARTHLEKIALFDDDKVHVHTIFRLPGLFRRPSANSRSTSWRGIMTNGTQGSSRSPSASRRRMSSA